MRPCGSYRAWTLWARGYPDQALLQAQESLRLAQELAHPYTLIWAHQFTAWLHQLRREAQATHRQVEAALPLVREHGFVQLVAQEQILRGWALAAQGQGEAGISQMREGLATWETLGVEVYRAYHSILKFFQVDITGMFRMTSSARYFKAGVGSSRPSWRWIMCFLERPKANTSCRALVKCCKRL